MSTFSPRFFTLPAIGNPTWIYPGLGIALGVWVMLGIYVFAEIRKTYDRNGVFTSKLLNLWFVIWGFYHLAVILSSLYAVWSIPINRTLAFAGGLVLIALGAITLATGMIEFRSLQRSCGQDTSQLITTGIYRWSRNPQFMGCLFYLLGLSLIGRSGFAFLLTGAASLVIYWYTVRLAEPYLERLYGDEYRSYKARTARWVGMPKKEGT
ncbi:MAG: isoprenylcysteine carboxylmethyltransferase family protein [Chloroflexi bacterium]|nr:isoprenylcysteine carboxylmethyltransferase family protein [Chloroflexota bacterium]